MGKSFSRELAEWMAKVDKQLSNLSSGNRLDHASLDGTTLYLRDADGNLSGRLGRQPDGSNGVHVVRVQPPPQLTAAILTVGEQAGTCLVEWDGGTFDGRRMPLIHGHTEIWAELVGEGWDPTVAPGDAGKRVGTIRDRTGGEVVVALPQAGMWAVWLRAMGADRETAGPWSPVATVEIKPLVDTEAIEAELEDARYRITEADERLSEGQSQLDGKLGELDIRVGPGVDGTSSLTEALDAGLSGVYAQAQDYAEQQASNAVSQAAANAQSEYDRLQEIAERALSRAGDNIVEDPSFETTYWINEWNGLGGRVARRSSPRTGCHSIAIEAGDTVELPLIEFNVEPDQSYRFQVWARTSPGNIADFGTDSRLRLLDPDTGGVVAESEPFSAATTYTRVTVTYQVPSDVSTVQAVVSVDHTEGLLLMDDISVQEVGAAAEALRLAEVARQQAEAAHIAAGNAVDAAASAYDAASSKSTIHWSLSAPSGTADNTDDVWWQYELRNGRRVVIGQWFWDDGVWRETEIAEEWLPLVNIGTGTYGTMTGDRLEAGSVSTPKLAIGDFQNMLPEDHLYAFAEDGAVGPWAGSQSDTAWEAVSHSLADIVLRHPDISPSSMTYLRFGQANGQGIKVKPGDQFVWTGESTGSPGARSNVNLCIRYSSESDAALPPFVSRSILGTLSGDRQFSRSRTVPEDSNIRRMHLEFRTENNYPGAVAIGNMAFRRMFSGEVLVDGAVKSRTVDTEEFFAAEAVIQKVWTDIVRSRLVESQGIITEDMIATGAITTPKLTVTEEMAAEVVKVMRLEGDEMDFNTIRGMLIEAAQIEGSVFLAEDAEGNTSVRLDGMSNFIAGELNTFATPAERDEMLGSNVVEGTTCSTITPSMEWRRENGEWVPMPGAWRLASAQFGSQDTSNPVPLNIHPELQGGFSRYEVVFRAGVVEDGPGPRGIMILPNSEFSSGYEHYRWLARVEEADGSVTFSSSSGSGTHPHVGYSYAFEGHVQVNLSPTNLGDTGYMTWEANGWANAGAGSGGRLVRSGGRWSRSDQVPITHFGVRPVNGTNRTWSAEATAELWGYR